MILLPKILSTIKATVKYVISILLFNFTAHSVLASTNNLQNLSTQQKLFISAEKSLKTSNWKLFRTQVDSLKNYPLKPYLRRDYLLSKWKAQPDNLLLQAHISKFIKVYSHDVVSRKVRSKWLHYLAEHNKPKTFLNYYQPGYGQKLECKNVEFKLRLSSSRNLNPDILQQAESIWMVGSSLPESCDGMINVLRSYDFPNQKQLEKRVILALNNKQKRLARYLAKKIEQINSSYSIPDILFSRNPLAQFKENPVNDKLGLQVTMNALTKLAWANPKEAIDYWENNSIKLDFNQVNTNKLKRTIALSLAIEGESNAKNWLESLDANTDLSVNQWLLTVAIYENDWDLIEHLARLKNSHSLEPDKWRYWRAVAAQRLGHSTASIRLFENLAKQRSYYGFLAAMQIKQQARLNIQQKKVDRHQYNNLTNKPEAKRAYELYKLDRLQLARSEWNNLQAKVAPSELVILAQIAHDWGWNHQSILAFAKSKQIDDVSKRFPRYKLNKYQLESIQHEIPLSWAYAITRQESAFKIDAVSSAGAKGLMQLTHGTAKQVHKRNKFKGSHGYKRSNQLLEPDTNIELGVAHLGELLKNYEGHPILATAAYNAGSHRVKQWLKDNSVSDPILWIEQIPYKETREYVKNVLTYQVIYSQLIDSNDSYIANLDQYIIPTTKKNNLYLGAHHNPL